MIVEWFTPRSRPRYEWLGQTGEMIATMESGDTSAIASLVGLSSPLEISADPENTLKIGTDGGLYAPPPQLATEQW